jgi:hypothetical protein
MSFNTVNLDLLTCIQKLKFLYMREMGFGLNNIQIMDLNLNFNLNQVALYNTTQTL